MIRLSPVLLCAASILAGRSVTPDHLTRFPQDTILARGQKVFATVCHACHTVDPPPTLAPPMSHVARHYRQAEPAPAAAVQRIAAWVAEPTDARSLLPPQARTRWGLMPPLLLPAEERVAVGHYVLSLADSAAHRGGMGRGMRRRMERRGGWGGGPLGP